jgi:hypothetical protein
LSELDELYSAKPDSFTALRRKLADAAKQRGEPDAARRISAARKPTTAAWIVNLLVLRHKEIKRQLGDLGDRLRAAHAAMDGEQIRRLSVEQRHLVDELIRTAFQTAEVKNPSAALREGVTGTLQAAIADPDVRAELGRLSKAEQWSGFGGFGAVAPVSTTGRGAAAKPAAKARADADRRRDELKAELAEAQQAQAEADRNLRAAKRDLEVATKAYDNAERASRDAAAAVKRAKARLR